MKVTVGCFLVLGSAVLGCAGVATDDVEAAEDALKADKLEVSAEERARYIAEGKVWLDRSLETIRRRTPAELLAGPPGGFAFDAAVTCDFVEPNPDDPLGGMTPKFECKLSNGEVVKVKYARNPEHNREVFSEVIGTRLLWALGLPADRAYPVRVTCNNCPWEPWAAHVQRYGSVYNKLRYQDPGPRGTRTFELAVIEKKFKAGKIEGPDGSAGWSFQELPERPQRYWRGSRAERETFDREHPELVEVDALRLLAAWMKHVDNKADNQRLVCLDVNPQGKCNAPLLMIHDTGITFGGGTVKAGMDYAPKALLADWLDQAKSPVWKDFDKCQAELDGHSWTGSMTDPRVTAAGQRFLTDRLAQLSDAQLRAIFTAARVDRAKDVMTDERTGQTRFVGVEDWVAGFKRMRDIVSTPCPDAS